jgi:hypothetical protein
VFMAKGKSIIWMSEISFWMSLPPALSDPLPSNRLASHISSQESSCSLAATSVVSLPPLPLPFPR